MSTWAQIAGSGGEAGTARGKLAYRLMIEGWPHEFVTSTLITHADNADGRAVYGGLLCEGLQIQDRIVMHEAKIQASGMTFKIRPTHGKRTSTGSEDPVTASFSTFPEPIAWLGAGIDGNDTTISLSGSASLEDDTVYYMGTETFRHDTGGTIERQIWDSLEQGHHPQNQPGLEVPYPVFDSPPSMEGRRAYLYAYGEHDDLDGDGTCIWRGIVSRPPSLDADGVTWLINAQPITHLFRQNIAASIAQTKPIGIMHHNKAALYVAMAYDGTEEARSIAFWARDEQGMVDRVNAEINDPVTGLLATTGADATIDSIRFERNSAGEYQLHATVGTSPTDDFHLVLSSPIFGEFFNANAIAPVGWSTIGGSVPDQGTTYGVQFNATGDWYAFVDPSSRGARNASLDNFAYDNGNTCYPLGDVTYWTKENHYKRLHPFYGNRESINKADTASTTAVSRRIYIDADFSNQVGDWVLIRTGDLQNTLKITDADEDGGYFYIEVDIPRIGGTSTASWLGFLTEETTIDLVRDYGLGTIETFVGSLKTEAIAYGNDGDSPFITDSDLSGWEPAFDRVPITQLVRRYRFITKNDLDTILSSELLFLNHFMRIEADGRIGITPLPTFTDAWHVDAAHTIDESSIITPYDGHGMWPRWEPQRDGRVTVVSMQSYYSDKEDEWLDEPIVFQDAVAIAIAKSRGKTEMKIRPYSVGALRFGENLTEADVADMTSIAKRYLSMFSQDYICVTLPVTYKHFQVVTGDVCSITCSAIPNGRGSKGMSGRRGVCIERRWNLDPIQKNHGELTFLVPAVPVVGYAPSAQITDQDNTSGDNWDLTCDVANNFNIVLSTGNDGQCLEHFADGDYIRILKRDSQTPTYVTGRIDGTPDAESGTCSVALDDPWTPGADSWMLEFDSAATGHTASQDRFVYVAGSDTRLADDSPARRFA